MDSVELSFHLEGIFYNQLFLSLKVISVDLAVKIHFI